MIRKVQFKIKTILPRSTNHLASEHSKGYFNAAIIQSGPLDMGLLHTDKFKTIPELHREFVETIGCNTDSSVECLQDKSVKDLMDGFQLSDECTNCVLYCTDTDPEKCSHSLAD